MDKAAIELPQVTLQHDIQSVLNDVKEGISSVEDVWISCYSIGKPSAHGFITLMEDGPGEVSLTPKPESPVQLSKVTSNIYTASCPSLGIADVTLRTPRKVYGDPTVAKPQHITAFDVAPNLSIFAIGNYHGGISVVSASSSSTLLSANLHLSAINSLHFFPSSEVILSASLDHTLSIISTKDLSVPRTLKGHIRAVTDSAIIEKGRNVLSSSKDGTIRLWDVSVGKQIKMMDVNSYNPILKMALGEMGAEDVMPPPDGTRPTDLPRPSNPAEIGTSDKLVFCALQNGKFSCIDLNTKLPVFTSDKPTVPQSSLHSIAYSPSHSLLATGALNGVVTVYDTRSLSHPLTSFRRNGACIEDLAFVPPSSLSSSPSSAHLLVAPEDGLPFRASVKPDGPFVVEELVGYDCDAVRVVKWAGDSAWTAGDDGVVRRY